MKELMAKSSLKNFRHAAAIMCIDKNNCSGITKFPATRGEWVGYFDE